MGNGNEVFGAPWWIKAAVNAGVPTILLGFAVWGGYQLFLKPMCAQQEAFIQSNIKSQDTLSASTSVLSEATGSMATSVQGINASLDDLAQSMQDLGTFTQSVNAAHQEHTRVLKDNNGILAENQQLIELDVNTAKEVAASMKRAEELMSGVPAQRERQNELLKEIRDRLPHNGGG